MRERRFLVALAVAGATVLGLSGTSSAFIGDDGFSYTQPAAELVMPFDAMEGKTSFLLVSNLTGTSDGSAGAKVSTHWTFWSEDCGELGDISICLTVNDTVVVDPRDIQAINEDNERVGPVINLDGNRGIVTVVAFETDVDCNDFRLTGSVLRDNALVGTFTFADTTAGYSFGNDAFGLGTDDPFFPTRVILPAPVDLYDLQTVNPDSVDASIVVLTHLRAASSGAVIPHSGTVRFATTFIDTLEVPTSLPDTTVSCTEFTTIAGGLIPDTVTVSTSGIIRFDPLSGLGVNDYLYGIVGQAVGSFGASSSLKTVSSPSNAFIEAPRNLLD